MKLFVLVKFFTRRYCVWGLCLNCMRQHLLLSSGNTKCSPSVASILLGHICTSGRVGVFASADCFHCPLLHSLSFLTVWEHFFCVNICLKCASDTLQISNPPENKKYSKICIMLHLIYRFYWLLLMSEPKELQNRQL